MPDQTQRIKDAMDGKRPLGAKKKRELSTNDKAGDKSAMTVREFVKRLSPELRSALYDELVEVMDADEEDEEE